MNIILYLLHCCPQRLIMYMQQLSHGWAASVNRILARVLSPKEYWVYCKRGSDSWTCYKRLLHFLCVISMHKPLRCELNWVSVSLCMMSTTASKQNILYFLISSAWVSYIFAWCLLAKRNLKIDSQWLQSGSFQDNNIRLTCASLVSIWWLNKDCTEHLVC